MERKKRGENIYHDRTQLHRCIRMVNAYDITIIIGSSGDFHVTQNSTYRPKYNLTNYSSTLLVRFL